MSRTELIAKAYAYLSYFFRDQRVNAQARHIYLFGSVARGDFDEESDIDIFIDLEKKYEQEVNKIAQRALNRFQEIEQDKWQLKGLAHTIKVQIGPLEEWELKSAVEREGIMLYSPSVSRTFQKYLLFALPAIPSPSKRMKILRALFGRQEKEYALPGRVQQQGGRIFSPRIFLVPSTAQQEISSLLSREKITFTVEEIWQ